MRAIEKICVGTNFTAESDVAVASAAAMARSFGASVHLVTVVEPIPVYRKVLNPIQARLVSEEELLGHARERLESARQAGPLAGLEVSVSARVGTPFAELVDAAREVSADLVVVGIQRASAVGRVLLGQTAERVLRKSPLPVLVAKRLLPARPSMVLAPTDFSPASRPAIELAVTLARHWAARLVFLHALEPVAEAYVWPVEPAPVQMYLAEPEEIEPEWEAYLSSVDLTGISWEKLTLKGYASAAVAEAVEQTGADLVVMGTHGRSGLAHALLGSVAEEVARDLDCAVLTVHPEA